MNPKPLFLRFDLSQAEDRIVKVLSHDPELIELANTKPWEFDTHLYNGGLLFEKLDLKMVPLKFDQLPKGCLDGVTKPERQASKKLVHLGNYDGQAQRASDALLDEGFIISPRDVDRRREIYHRRFPGIRGGYQLRTRMLVIQERRLTTSWGFEIRFPYERLDGQLWRRAYAWRPQSEVGYLLNQKGVIVAYDWINVHNRDARISFQVHDEIAISVGRADIAWDLSRVLRENLESEREYEGERLSIPADMAIERRYHGRDGDCIEYKRFPTKEEFFDGFDRLSGV